MNYRRLGRTNLRVSVVGFGTCQLRLVPERQAIATLRRGFELGVNLVHIAPDYEGVDGLVVRALEDAPADVIVCNQGYGPMDQFERHFEETCEKFGKERLELFGITCVEDREAAGENLWGRGGQAEFLLRKKEEGRLGGIFCTTHKSPAYIRKLIETDVFDALMISYNMLGFHLLSESFPPIGEDPRRDTVNMTILRLRRAEGFEDLQRNRSEIFPLAASRDIGLMIMKPLAGGLLCRGKAFSPRARLIPESSQVGATDALRFILRSQDVTCVVPGTASPEEAEENARAGHGALDLPGAQLEELDRRAHLAGGTICSRCGQCEGSCSQKLSIPWLFRAGYIAAYPSETFETPDEFEYFRLHPDLESLCATCPDVTCSCPEGIDIRAGLFGVHQTMVTLMKSGQVPSPAALEARRGTRRGFGATLVTRELPAAVTPGVPAVCRVYVQNSGRRPWDHSTVLRVSMDGRPWQQIRLRGKVAARERAHFSFELVQPPWPGPHTVRLDLARVDHGSRVLDSLTLLKTQITVQDGLDGAELAPHV